jgi:hypothetical protein
VRALWRILLLIPLGFVLACFAAGGFLVLAVIGTDGVNFTDYGAETVVLVFATAIFVGGVAAAPAFIAIAIAEIFALRTVIFYLLAGGAIGLAAHLFNSVGDEPISGADAQLFLATGCVGGLVYWLVAGRSAGLDGRVTRITREKERIASSE